MDPLVSVVLAAILTVVVVWALLVAALWLARPRGTGLGDVIRVVPDVLRLARSLLRDASAPRSVRIALALLVVWLLSPIDLIPEFIPVLGPLDDAVVAVLVLRFVRRRLGDAALRARWPGNDAGWAIVARLIGAQPGTGPSSPDA